MEHKVFFSKYFLMILFIFLFLIKVSLNAWKKLTELIWLTNKLQSILTIIKYVIVEVINTRHGVERFTSPQKGIRINKYFSLLRFLAAWTTAASKVQLLKPLSDWK